MNKRLSGKAAIVTGGGRGIGKGIALVLSREDATVLIVDLDENSAKKTAEEIQERGGHASYFRADVTSMSDMKNMADLAIERYGKIDVLCPNVGIYPSVLIENMTEKDWDTVLSVNLKSVFLTVKVCSPYMTRRNYGKIIITSSITGPRTGFPGMAHYGASKAGIIGFIKTAALEFAKYNVTVNGVEPGTVFTEQLSKQLGTEAIRESEKLIPLRRLAEPEDIGNAVLFLASDESRYITGQTIVVDGGRTLVDIEQVIGITY